MRLYKWGGVVPKPGCCPSCDGTGASGEECTNGACWDCQATGHPHIGRCRSAFLDWWHLHETVAMWLWVAWIVCGAVALAVVSAEWYAWAYPIAALTGYHVFFACSKLADRQIERRGPPR